MSTKDVYSTTTEYNFSSKCSKCNKIIPVVENIYRDDSGVCADCTNRRFGKSLKNGLA